MKQNRHPTTEQQITSHKRVFLCYCRQDLRYASRLRVHLASCQQTTSLTVWDDSQIQVGSLWKNEIASQLSSAHFAVLLVSADFLASPFITTFELPYLLNAAQSGGTRILSVIVRPCLFEESPLVAFQTVNNLAQPLSQLSSNAREQIWVSVVRTLISSSNSSHVKRPK